MQYVVGVLPRYELDALIRILVDRRRVTQDQLEALFSTLPPEVAADLPATDRPRQRLERSLAQLDLSGDLAPVLTYLANDPEVDIATTGRRLLSLLDSRATAAEVRPAAQPRLFVGRAAELAAMHDALLGRPTRVVVLAGPPGEGKSYLATHFAHLHRERFPGGLRRLALGDDDRSVEEWLDVLRENPDRRDLDVARALVAQGALVVIENVDAARGGATAKAIIDRLPGVPIIATARHTDFGTSPSLGWTHLRLPSFTEVEARDLISGELPGITAADRERLLASSGRLPLAIHLAGAVLRRGRTLDWYLDRLERGHFEERGRDPADPVASLDTRLAVSLAVFVEEAEGIARGTGERWHRALEQLGLGPIEGFGDALAAVLTGLPREETEDLVDLARSLSLLAPVDTRMASRAHPLTARWLANRLSDNGRRAAGTRLAAWIHERALDEPAATRLERWATLREELPGLHGWFALATVDELQVVVTADINFAQATGVARLWLEILERVLAVPSLARSRRALMLVNAATLSHLIGDPERARAYAEKARAGTPANSPTFALAALELARADLARGAIDLADRRLHMEVLPVLRDERLASAMSLLAEIRSLQDRVPEAAHLLMVARRIPNLPAHPRATLARQLATLHLECGRPAKAKDLYVTEIIPAYEASGDLVAVASALADLADLEDRLGDTTALDTNAAALDQLRQLGAERDVAITLGQRADMLRERRRLREAADCADEAAAILELHGDRHARAIMRMKTCQIWLADEEGTDRARIAQVMDEEVIPALAGDVAKLAAARHLRSVAPVIGPSQ